MKKFVSGMLVGTAITVAALAGVATTIKKTVIDPIEEKEDMIEEKKKFGKESRKEVSYRRRDEKI